MHRSHHTKTKGDLGVLKAQVDLFEQGFTVCVPQTEHAPFDLVAYKDGRFRRVQVKFRTLEKNGVLQVRFATCWAEVRRALSIWPNRCHSIAEWRSK